MKKIKYLGLGHPRTGTGFTSKTLSSFGLRVGHEKLYPHGIVAWQLLKEHGPWPWMPQYNKQYKVRLPYEYLIYNVRDPKTSIPSIVYTEDIKDKSFNFRRDSFGFETSENRVEQAILSILKFDELIMDMQPDLVYRIEDQAEELYKFISQHYPNLRWVEPKGKENSRKHDGFETLEDEFKSVRPEIQDKINDFCIKHGYDKLF